MSGPIRGSTPGSARRGLRGPHRLVRAAARALCRLAAQRLHGPVVGMPALCAGRCRWNHLDQRRRQRGRQQFRLADVETTSGRLSTSQLRGRPTGADTSTRFRGCRRSAAQRYCVLEDRRSRIREAGDRGWRFNGARPMRRHAARAVFPAVVRGWHAHPRGARSRGFVGLYALGIATRFHRPRNGRMLQADGIFFRGSD